MDDISATEAARNLSRILDAVEHDGATYRIVRHGVAVAQLSPVTTCTGGTLKSLLATHSPDDGWTDDLRDVRELLESDPRWT